MAGPYLTLCLLLASAANLCKKFGHGSGSILRYNASKLFDTDDIPERIFSNS